MNDKRNDADEASFEDLMSFETLPPPPGTNEGDVHNARTTVAALPDSFLDELKAAAAERVDSSRGATDLVATRRAKPFEMPVGMLPPPPPSASSLEAAPPTPRHVARPAAPELPSRTPTSEAAGPPLLSSDDLASAVGAALAQGASQPRVDAAPPSFPPVLSVAPDAPGPFSAPAFSPPVVADALASHPSSSHAPHAPLSLQPLPLAGTVPPLASELGAPRPPRSRKLLVAVIVMVLAGLGLSIAFALLRGRFL